MSKKRKPEAIFIPNQRSKNTEIYFLGPNNAKDIEMRFEHEQRRKKHFLKNK